LENPEFYFREAEEYENGPATPEPSGETIVRGRDRGKRKEAQQGRLNSKYVADDFIANRQRTIFNQRLWTHRVKIKKRIKGEILSRAIENANFKDIQFIS
jgi:hypothetical protein